MRGGTSSKRVHRTTSVQVAGGMLQRVEAQGTTGRGVSRGGTSSRGFRGVQHWVCNRIWQLSCSGGGRGRRHAAEGGGEGRNRKRSGSGNAVQVAMERAAAVQVAGGMRQKVEAKGATGRGVGRHQQQEGAEDSINSRGRRHARGGGAGCNKNGGAATTAEERAQQGEGCSARQQQEVQTATLGQQQ